MDIQTPQTPPLPHKRLRLLALFLAAVAVFTLSRVLFRDPWAGYRTVASDQMVYTRPDTEAFLAAMDRLGQAAQTAEDYGAVQEAYRELNRLYGDYLSQSTLCYVRYSLNILDPLYSVEQGFFEETDALVQQGLDEMYHAVAGSPFEQQLEEDYFGEGFFDSYQGESSFDEELVRLYRREDELINDYSQMMSNPTVLYQNKEQSFRSLMDTLPAEELPALLDAFYQGYAPTVSQLYCQLVQVRQEIAAALGYESYAHYIYASYSRSFLPETALEYCQQVRKELLPLLSTLYQSGTVEESTPIYSLEKEDLWAFFSAAVKELGAEAKEAYDFLERYSLCLLTDGENRIPGSYTTYLYNYDAPIIVAQQTHTSDDLATVAHEFGHFMEYYTNFGGNSGIDVSECISQGMELLIFSHLDSLMSAKDATALETGRLMNILRAIVEQAGFHEFELAVYSLPPEELTFQRLTRLSEEYLGGAILSFPGNQQSASLAWISINHFFTSPFYTISYSLSADVALQIYSWEEENHSITPLLRLIGGEERYDLSQAAVDARLVDPLSKERVEALRDLFKTRFLR